MECLHLLETSAPKLVLIRSNVHSFKLYTVLQVCSYWQTWLVMLCTFKENLFLTNPILTTFFKNVCYQYYNADQLDQYSQ